MTDRLMYGPVEGETTVGVVGTIRPGGAGNVTGFDGTTFWGAAESLLDSSKTVKSLEVGSLMGGSYHLRILYTDNTSAYLAQQHLSASQLLTYGITAVSNPSSGTIDDIDLTPIIGPSGIYSANRVTEFYGPVSGNAARVTRVYGPAEGTIYVADWDDTYLTSFDSNAFFSKLEQTYPGEIPLGISLNKGYVSQIGVTVYSLNLTTDQTQGGTPHLIDNGETTSVVDTARQWGFNPNSAFSSSESALAIVRFSAESGFVSKLIHQGFGHLDYS